MIYSFITFFGDRPVKFEYTSKQAAEYSREAALYAARTVLPICGPAMVSMVVADHGIDAGGPQR